MVGADQTGRSREVEAVQKTHFGRTSTGRDVEVYVLRNGAGAEVSIATYGGMVLSIKVPDRSGRIDDVVLGFDSLEEYERHRIFMGALIGRYGNRIAHGRFSLNGKMYSLAKNNGENHLHGGHVGFDRVIWQAEPDPDGSASIELTYRSVNGEEGYPGNLDVTVLYTLTDENELRIDYSAETDADTIVNLTNHTYFNLGGTASDTILDHRIAIKADKFTPTDAGSIPNGELRDVTGTPFDLRHGLDIGSRINEDDEQLRFGRGYDHNWVLNKDDNTLTLAASVIDPSSGRLMEVFTTEPGLQFYSGNFLDGAVNGKGGRPYGYRSGFCLEAQHFPDSPNQPHFPSTVLRPGERYSQTTVYRFSAQDQNEVPGRAAWDDRRS